MRAELGQDDEAYPVEPGPRLLDLRGASNFTAMPLARVIVPILALCLANPAMAQHPRSPAAQHFATFVDGYLDRFAARHPSIAVR